MRGWVLLVLAKIFLKYCDGKQYADKLGKWSFFSWMFILEYWFEKFFF